MEALEKFHKRDMQILQCLTPYILAILSHEQYGLPENAIYSLNQLIGRILKGDVTEDSYIIHSMADFGWQNSHHFFCMVFLADPIDVQNHTVASICRRLENQVPASCVVEFDRQIVMFVNLDQGGISLPEAVHCCTELIRDSNLKAGISRSYEGFHLSFQLLHRQAAIALNLGQRYLPERWLHHFDDISARYQLELLVSELPAEMICTPELLKMYQYDLKNNTEYYLTLKTYLENNMQPVITASLLFVHRTTPVSYTHLQIVHEALVNRPDVLQLPGQQLLLLLLIRPVLQILRPVSYTHLSGKDASPGSGYFAPRWSAAASS